ncbi:aminoglycoside phosphotransferase family protein [Tessaracoccus sp. OH4464_COT-324]|uniref:aminoglycoside phosphotransferase family protein n=1 Tax=Tessaracoccus sp. OH4464_COT-324 TaxID=2491059 RepID=UPI000F63D2FC|nr:aminoglycoside phosphotransferase family protein [Tessaracoccus sp. OH4464_COT-324]RRD46662.1 aminoglycoside phosphotransferase family protein [Tessaracoccus sp. OH4464_COT-324]
MSDDGAELLTGPGAEPLLAAAVSHAGGELLSWELDHVDQTPEQSTTATYRAVVEWPHGTRPELLGVSARSGELQPSDSNAEIFADGNRQVAVWIYPNDPDLPGLSRAAFPEAIAELLKGADLVPKSVSPDEVELSIIGYRPRRRAVVRASALGQTFYVKILRPRLFSDVLHRHRLLAGAGLPAPKVVATTPDHLLVTRELPGIPLARAIFDPGDPCRAEDLIALLDAMPAAAATLERRPPWAEAVEHYGRLVVAPAPELAEEVRWVVRHVERGLADYPHGNEPTHGDFHEGQVHVADGRIVGILDVDTLGPGRRADDLACLIGHLSTIQRMNTEQEAKVRDILARWVPVFDQRVDPVELRLRAAAVVLSLATGPYRAQEADWLAQTRAMVRSASSLVSQVV